jgi:hypothetical protein
LPTVVQAIDILADRGPALGRPLVDHVEHSAVQNLKERGASCRVAAEIP